MLRIAVTGASGYMGAELLRLLTVHPKVRISAVTSERLAGERLDRVYPHLRGLSDLVFQEIHRERLADEADVVFLALPHMESQRLMPTLRRHGKKAIDLSADYRLKDATLYTTWYKAPHEDASGLAEAVYGLPELHRKQVAGASLVASPGCYPMGAILATAPLLNSGRGSVEVIVIDGKSGVTGAGAQGRKADPMYLFTEANENVQAYAIGTHRHTPEIEQELSALAGRPVVGSNFCDVTVVADPRTKRAVCVSALDNLGKGGSANGIQNLNIMMGWDERTGLDAPPVYP